MEKNDLQQDHSSSNLLNWIFAAAIGLVACAIAWVGWTCVDSIQKNAGKLHNYNVTADNTKIDTHHFDIVKNEIDPRLFASQTGNSEELQSVLLNQAGSERVLTKATAAMDNKQFAQAAEYCSQALAKIPLEAKTKTTWYCDGNVANRSAFIELVMRKRATCYMSMGRSSLAIADLTAAIKERPGNGNNWAERAKVYYKLGQKGLGDADTKKAQALFAEYARLHHQHSKGAPL
jgi:tetratricopeptide (TPR) repeat protein